DVIGFQRVQDAINFRTVVRRLLKFPIRQNQVLVPTASLGESSSAPGSEAWLNNHVVNRYYRDVTVKEFPISIDTQSYAELAQDPAVRQRAREIREELGNPQRIILGVDRLDYTKGIRHRLKAFGELLDEER